MRSYLCKDKIIFDPESLSQRVLFLATHFACLRRTYTFKGIILITFELFILLVNAVVSIRSYLFDFSCCTASFATSLSCFYFSCKMLSLFVGTFETEEPGTARNTNCCDIIYSGNNQGSKQEDRTGFQRCQRYLLEMEKVFFRSISDG